MGGGASVLVGVALHTNWRGRVIYYAVLTGNRKEINSGKCLSATSEVFPSST